MLSRILLTILAVLWVTCFSEAGSEDRLLRKFNHQNESSVHKWQTEVERALANAAALKTSSPIAAKGLLRSTLEAMEKDTPAPGEDRLTLIRRLYDALQEMESLLAEKRTHEAERKSDWTSTVIWQSPERDGPTYVSPPIYAPLPIAASFQTTPVISADRRYVRIGVRGNFILPRINYTPVPVFTPTILQGPGNGITVLPIYGLRLSMVPTVGFTTGSINTTVSAPAGGTVVAGGFSSRIDSRIESGVPVLGGIPYVNRLFRNRAYGSSTSGFRVLVSPTIIELD